MTRFLTLFKTILVILVLAFTVLPALGVDHPHRQGVNSEGTENQTAFPRIRFDVMSYDVGTVNQHETITHLFTFTNTGSGTLSITKIKAG